MICKRLYLPIYFYKLNLLIEYIINLLITYISYRHVKNEIKVIITLNDKIYSYT